MLWRNLDTYNDGSVTAHQVQRWLQDQVQFTIPQHRIHFIEDAFDTIKRDGRISEKEFMTVLSGPEEEEDEGQEEGQEDEYGAQQSEPE